MSEDYEAKLKADEKKLKAELSAIGRIDTILRKLEPGARGRVVRHLADLHGKAEAKP